jgi:putative SOS response-associated peptidase YedK
VSLLAHIIACELVVSLLVTSIATLHNWMPVILSDRDADDWLNPRKRAPLSVKRLLNTGAEDLLVMQSDSPLVNSIRDEGPKLLGDYKGRAATIAQLLRINLSHT